MDSFKRQAILLELLDAMNIHGSRCGETNLQKCAYFLDIGIGVPLDIEFILYKHGPFSFDLREQLGEMRGNFLIDLEYRDAYGASLIVTEFGRVHKRRFPKTIARYEKQIGYVAAKLSARGVIELERLGTALYVRRQHPDHSPENDVRAITALKPHIHPEDALTAVLEVKKLLDEAPPVGMIRSVVAD